MRRHVVNFGCKPLLTLYGARIIAAGDPGTSDQHGGFPGLAGDGIPVATSPQNHQPLMHIS